MSEHSFSQRLITWQHQYGRHHLPWQVSDPYRIWVSEIMLQQTQVSTVLNYYPPFIAAFPDVYALAYAEQDAVLQLWAGLGYYSRARNLHKAAKQICEQFQGKFPHQRTQLEQLCGIGRSTAAAIVAFAFSQRETILDGNVKRVLCRVFAIDGDPSTKAVEQQLWSLGESLLPKNATDIRAYTQGLMDLGAIICKRTKPLCAQCPMLSICQAHIQNRIAQLPQKKAATKLQHINLTWLVMRRNDGAIYLNKRPQQGIWAGLYCVPCFDNLQQLHTFLTHFMPQKPHLQAQIPFLHRLTHRLLNITPYEMQYHCPHHTNLDKGIWVLPEQLSHYGLPKPLHTYLHTKNYQGNLF